LYSFVDASVPATQPWLESFKLVTDFPRRHLVNRDATLAQSGIGNMALLHVICDDDDDDDDDNDNTASSTSTTTGGLGGGANNLQQHHT
jgi:hypothetical protein